MPRRLQVNLGTLMLAVALVAVVLALLVQLGRSAIFLALGVIPSGIYFIIYVNAWSSCRKNGRKVTPDDRLAAERVYRRIAPIVVVPLWVAASFWFWRGR